MKRMIMAFGVFALCACMCGATEYFVDKNRPDDSGAGTSEATAFKTIQAAVAQAAPVMEVAAVPFRRSNTDLGGISCLGIHELAAKGSILKEDQNILLIDNIRIDHSPAGCIVVFR
jgi:hypothetical protein